jgi:hypothetical protein
VRARAAALGALAILAGCGGGDAAAPRSAATATPTVEHTQAAPPNDEQQIEALLRDRAAALEAGKRREYAATAIGRQRRRDRDAAARAARLSLRDVTLEPGRIDLEGDRAGVRVTLSYGVTGIRGSFQSTRRVDAVRAGKRWRIAREHGGRGQPPWEVEAFTERRTQHFVVLAPPDAAVDDLLASLESGYKTILGVLERGRLRRRYLVVVAADSAQARALTTEIRGVETLAAIADAAISESGPERRTVGVLSLRLLVVLPAFAALDPDGRVRVITHELTHAALTGATSGRTPAWLVEGVALYVSGDRRPAPAGADLRALSAPDAIARASGDAQAEAYATSSAAAFAIADRFGSHRLLKLYDAFNDPKLVGEPGQRLVARAVRRELGVSLAELQAGL